MHIFFVPHRMTVERYVSASTSAAPTNKKGVVWHYASILLDSSSPRSGCSAAASSTVNTRNHLSRPHETPFWRILPASPVGSVGYRARSNVGPEGGQSHSDQDQKVDRHQIWLLSWAIGVTGAHGSFLRMIGRMTAKSFLHQKLGDSVVLEGE